MKNNNETENQPIIGISDHPLANEMKTLYTQFPNSYSADEISIVTIQPSPAGENLMLAAESGNLKEVDKLLEKGANVNEKSTKHKKTALMLAAEKGYLEVVDKLLEKCTEVTSEEYIKAQAMSYLNDSIRHRYRNNLNNALIKKYPEIKPGILKGHLMYMNFDMENNDKNNELNKQLFELISTKQYLLRDQTNQPKINEFSEISTIINETFKDSKEYTKKDKLNADLVFKKLKKYYNIDLHAESALILASRGSHTKVVQKLLSSGNIADLSFVNRQVQDAGSKKEIREYQKSPLDYVLKHNTENKDQIKAIHILLGNKNTKNKRACVEKLKELQSCVINDFKTKISQHKKIQEPHFLESVNIAKIAMKDFSKQGDAEAISEIAQIAGQDKAMKYFAKSAEKAIIELTKLGKKEDIEKALKSFKPEDREVIKRRTFIKRSLWSAKNMIERAVKGTSR